MKALLAKIKTKEFVQNLLVEIIGDIIMILMGLGAGYYIKVALIG
ncbi:hypothetical protein PP175_27180 (plasmid) [Aneurinibacillus sp. Ricciae_BoGa-3]|nr:hypothetical protein [Aneurinibacillus sp. Ricciae_BoGa-3]WCK57722.1 hypothetical protein PP175_27180 [Aneurinibacillus sp. Ricciae_BoGa-3]